MEEAGATFSRRVRDYTLSERFIRTIVPFAESFSSLHLSFSPGLFHNPKNNFGTPRYEGGMYHLHTCSYANRWLFSGETD